MTKIYVPRLIIPISAIIVELLDFLIASFMLVGLMLYFGCMPAATAALLPFLLLIAMGAALGAGLFFGAVNVRYRDVRTILPFLLQIWMYLTVIFPFSQLPARWGNWRYLCGLNPMAGVVEGFRWCLMHPYMENSKNVTAIIPRDKVEEAIRAGNKVTSQLMEGQVVWKITESVEQAAVSPWPLIAIGSSVTILMLLIGLAYFRKVEVQFADII